MNTSHYFILGFFIYFIYEKIIPCINRLFRINVLYSTLVLSNIALSIYIQVLCIFKWNGKI